MADSNKSTPTPDLRIIPIHQIYPHEEHDAQRSAPLIEVLQNAEYMTNPPIVASVTDNQYVVLDGANRHYTLQTLGYKYVLVQVVDYNSEFVELDVWNHIVSDWRTEEFLEALHSHSAIDVRVGTQHTDRIASVIVPSSIIYSICAECDDVHARNAVLRDVTRIYQRNATLYRTSSHDPDEIWSLYPNAIAIVTFESYSPKDIMEAAIRKAYLPPGISRHIIHGRVLKLNYPFSAINDDSQPLEQKNRTLRQWIEQKLAKRDVRFYAEATFQFDE